ncbi:FKBP-type peptidylprolyl cis-trans isomerase SlyD [Meiothermus taiwanensis WR-220]|jgi:FKBP-type peptidyl-prolyl cis-trans isomerase SlyD|uniref:peptidylprolyl isomerase n=2 Tax=Meiothermus taiwanensis TaxID=172827 RepID=A0A399DTB7_9DEIN|nr:FKBP-type peptidylprolyl cis-trans isomerase SlyD [Meiothermus taiwanensis WR-220]KIQ55327.1 peptidylprolyl isomerase [Meiothermus taiwanensis]KZK15071.1 peptidylprolyl isomerase [Meiothermus taiwanensis]RIH74378.1 FKBP-type peptidyl-prolyl cis-trans isomerase SlyD [Meiothermus taiwanensis]
MQIGSTSVVKLEYQLWVDGRKLEGTDGQPKTILMGHAPELPPGLEANLLGKKPGSYQIFLPPEPYNPDLCTVVPAADLPEPPRLGAGYTGESPDGRLMLYRVVHIDGERVTLDANPPLAGKTLEYHLIIHSVRHATPEELEHGHVHGEGGVQH